MRWFQLANVWLTTPSVAICEIYSIPAVERRSDQFWQLGEPGPTAIRNVGAADHPGAAARVVRSRARPWRAAEPRRPGAARARALRAGLEQRLRQEQTRVRDPSPRRRVGAARSAREAGRARLRQPGRRSTGGKASGADPKDKIEEYQTLNTLMREGLDQPARGPLCRQPRALRGICSSARSTASRRTITPRARWPA